VLLVDDASDNRRILSYFLARSGIEVVVAEDGCSALEAFNAAQATGEQFHAIITDMEMPELNGYELARILRMRGETLPIIACTAHSTRADVERCFEAGCSAHVTKPIIAADLMHTIAAELAEQPAMEECTC
jgi:CheY-like chemotaxis protein